MKTNYVGVLTFTFYTPAITTPRTHCKQTMIHIQSIGRKSQVQKSTYEQ